MCQEGSISRHRARLGVLLEVCCRAVLLTVFLARVFWVYGGVTWGHKGCIFRHRARSGDHFGGMLKGRFTDSAP